MNWLIDIFTYTLERQGKQLKNSTMNKITDLLQKCDINTAWNKRRLQFVMCKFMILENSSGFENVEDNIQLNFLSFY